MKVGIIGCGAIAGAHLRALGPLGVEVVGVCDVREDRARRTAAAFGVGRAYRDAEELLDRHRPDVVHVLTPPQAHREVAIQAMQAGSHVLVEKPMAIDVAEADEMIEESRRAGRMLGSCHNLLFDPAVLEARALARAGDLGRIIALESTQTIPGAAFDRFMGLPWIHGLPGGVVHELAPHGVYLHREFIGALHVASAVLRASAGPPAPSVEFRVLFESEVAMSTGAIVMPAAPSQNVLRIYGTDRTLHVHPREHLLLAIDQASRGGFVRRALPNLALGMQLVSRTVASTLAGLGRPGHRGHSALIRGFYEAVRDGAPPPVTGEDGRAVVAVLDRLWEALGPPVPGGAA